MASQKASYTKLDQEYLEEEINKLQEDLRSYARPLKDRVEWKQLKDGRAIPLLIASKEDQMKAIAFILEKLPRMLQALEELREKAAKKKELKKGYDTVNDILEEDD